MIFESDPQIRKEIMIHKKRERKIKHETSEKFLKRFSKRFLFISFSIIFLIVIIIISFSMYNMNHYEGSFMEEGKVKTYIHADYYEVHGSFVTFYKYWWRLGRKEILTGRIGYIKREKVPKYKYRSSGGSLLDSLDFGDGG